MQTFLSFSPYMLLSCSILALLFNRKWPMGVVLFSASVVAGIYADRLNLVGLLVMTAYLGVYGLYRRRKGRVASLFLSSLVLVFSFNLFTHSLPGFNNLRVLENILLAQDSLPYSLWLNFDKPLIAIGFLGFFEEIKREDYNSSLKIFGIWLPISLVSLMLLSYYLGYIRLDPKVPDFIFLWSFKVLFLTCFSEECLFRGILWKTIEDFFDSKKLALVATSLAFGFLHFEGGWKYVLLSTVAGLFYGMVYLKTKRIGFSIALHFVVNLVHILFFSYPALV